MILEVDNWWRHLSIMSVSQNRPFRQIFLFVERAWTFVPFQFIPYRAVPFSVSMYIYIFRSGPFRSAKYFLFTERTKAFAPFRAVPCCSVIKIVYVYLSIRPDPPNILVRGTGWSTVPFSASFTSIFRYGLFNSTEYFCVRNETKFRPVHLKLS